MYTPQDEKRLYNLAKELLDVTDPDDAAYTIASLRDVINYADWKYYVQSEPVLADIEYDTLYKKLVALEEKYPEHADADSPTQRVARGLSERFPAVSHLVPMLSLDNTYNAEDLYAWDKKCRDAAGIEHIEYCVEPKYDGASISLIYENDRLLRGATRGDGVMGEEITTNVRQIKSLPLNVKLAKDGISQIEIRGEVVIHKEVFAQFNEARVKEGQPPLANPRNAASGTLRMLDPEEVRRRRLSAIVYHVADYELATGKVVPEAMGTHYGSLEYLYNLGFPTPVKEMKKITGINGVIEHCLAFEARRDELPYEVDGLVIKVNDLLLQEKMGMTSHHPRWATAFKFKARQATTKLVDVIYNVGRTGAVSPVAKLEPVAIGGVTVTNVSLFNEDVIKEKDLMIGDTVIVERAGDVIPYIVKPLAALRDGSEQVINYPRSCPRCSEPLERPEEEAVWRCINAGCPAQVVERLIHYCSKDAMDIRGMGESNVTKFHKLGIMPDIPSLYNIDWDKVRALGGFGEKSISNLQTAIENSKQQPLGRLIFGLGIRHVGETMAKTLASAVKELTEFYNWTEEQLLTLEDVGPKVAASVAHFFQLEENRELIAQLAALGVNMQNVHRSKSGSDGELSGQTFLFTGTLSRLKRSDAEALVEEKGGTILSGVSAKLNNLVVGEDAGSKLEKAKKLGSVRILTEDEFIALAGIEMA